MLADGSRRVIETKGREDPDVAHKDRAAMLWCENAARLTGVAWRYLKVPQTGFDRLQPSVYEDLVVFEADRAQRPVRRIALADEGDESYLRSLTPAERIAMVWPITLQAWAFKEGPRGEPRLRRDAVRIVRGGR